MIVDFGSRPRQAHNRATTARPCTSRLQTHIHQVPQSVFLRAPFVSPGSLQRLPAAAAATRLIQQRHPACVSSFVDSDRLSSSTRPAFSACRQTPLPQLWVLVVSTSVSRAHVFPFPARVGTSTSDRSTALIRLHTKTRASAVVLSKLGLLPSSPPPLPLVIPLLLLPPPVSSSIRSSAGSFSRSNEFTKQRSTAPVVPHGNSLRPPSVEAVPDSTHGSTRPRARRAPRW